MDPEKAIEIAEFEFHTRRQGLRPVFRSRQQLEEIIYGLGQAREDLRELREDNERLKRRQNALGSETPEESTEN